MTAAQEYDLVDVDPLYAQSLIDLLDTIIHVQTVMVDIASDVKAYHRKVHACGEVDGESDGPLADTNNTARGHEKTLLVPCTRFPASDNT